MVSSRWPRFRSSFAQICIPYSGSNPPVCRVTHLLQRTLPLWMSPPSWLMFSLMKRMMGPRIKSLLITDRSVEALEDVHLATYYIGEDSLAVSRTACNRPLPYGHRARCGIAPCPRRSFCLSGVKTSCAISYSCRRRVRSPFLWILAMSTLLRLPFAIRICWSQRCG